MLCGHQSVRRCTYFHVVCFTCIWSSANASIHVYRRP